MKMVEEIKRRGKMEEKGKRKEGGGRWKRGEMLEEEEEDDGEAVSSRDAVESFRPPALTSNK